MTTKNEPLPSIQARIEELQNTIVEKEKQIKSRALHLSDNLKAEIAPIEIVKKYPFQAAGITFVSALLLTRALRGSKKKSVPAEIEQSALPSQGHGALYTAETLIKDGFKVLPYCTEDLILCQRLVDVGCQAVMPWAAPIGTGQGPLNPYAMKLLRERLQVPLLVDAGLGLPSHACTVMEWGFDGVLLNTAVALAEDPVVMAKAFAMAVDAGRSAFLSGAMQAQDSAQASTPLVGTPFWHQS